MKRKGKVISIGNQKGGVGKSTITSMVANYIHKYEKQFKLLVLDADDLQQTLSKIRDKELDVYSEEDVKNLYNLDAINSKDFEKQIETLKKTYDFIFVDLPGNLKQEGVIPVYCQVDHLFIPTSSSIMDIDSTVEFANFFNNAIIPIRSSYDMQTTVMGFFNRIEISNPDFKELYMNKEKFPIKFMENFIPKSRVFEREASTINTYENERYGEYDEFCKEIIDIIKN